MRETMRYSVTGSQSMVRGGSVTKCGDPSISDP
jgi:hypothetical protein